MTDAADPAAAPPAVPARPAQDWRILLAVFWVTSMVEGLGVSQIFALLPTYLREMGVAPQDRLAFIGIFSALIFIVGMPLVPLWGAWADKYSRKVVIIRSALVEAVVFAAVALAREPWQLAIAMLLIGFQLGNTGIMLAGIRDVAPLRRIGTAIAVFGASGPVGFAVGPALAGILIDGFGWELSAVFAFSALLSVGTAALVAFGSKEVRPEVVPTGRIVDLAYASLRGVLSDPATRRIFLIFGISFLAIQMSRPYIPVLVEGITGLGIGLASAIGLVAGTAALVGALISPLGGVIGDRIGFRPVLVTALGGAAVVLFLMPRAESLEGLALLAVGLGAATASVSSMVFGLLATELPPERRSAALNLVYLPLYAAGTIGPAVGAVVASVSGVNGLFVVGACIFMFGALTIVLRRGPIGEPQPVGSEPLGTGSTPAPSRSARPSPRDDEPRKHQGDERTPGQRQRLARLDEPVALTRDDEHHDRVLGHPELVVRIRAAEVLVADEAAIRQHELLVDVEVARARIVVVRVHRDRDGLGRQDHLVDLLAAGQTDRRDDGREDDPRQGAGDDRTHGDARRRRRRPRDWRSTGPGSRRP